MFPDTYRKFYTFIALALMLALGATAMLEPGDISPSAMAVYDIASLETNFDWSIFFFGLAIGSMILGAVIYLVQYEKNR